MTTRRGRAGLALLFLTTNLLAGGYKITTLSVDGTALSAACVAANLEADAAYFNPANMVWMAKRPKVSAALTYVGLSKVDYESRGGSKIASRSEGAFLPGLFWVAAPRQGWRFGLAVVSPAGLTKRWNDQPARFYAHRYELKTLEVNPVLAWQATEWLALGGGVRGIYAKARVSGDGEGLPATDPRRVVARDMEGDSFDTGYNLALSIRPTERLALAVTYRSRVDLTLSGRADVTLGTYRSRADGRVKSLVPASAALAVSYDFERFATVELVYERTYWSDNDTLDFDFEDPTVEGALGAPVPKRWKDAAAYRLGIGRTFEGWRGMAGLFYDESPVPDRTLGYETPDADAYGFSLGVRYPWNEKLAVSAAGMYLIKKDRKVSGENLYAIDGEFTGNRACILTVGIDYDF